MGNTLLMLAIRNRDISKSLAILLETVRFLIKAGANLNIQEAVSPKHHKLVHACMHGEHFVLFCTDWKNCSHFCC